MNKQKSNSPAACRKALIFLIFFGFFSCPALRAQIDI